ncbi:LON peptidase substrate-binding domain-containing protein [Salibacter halophilus]|uniref:Lon N-terminal domain-containing protein n=1 Tax=Salibacter halophilus TaxID=1803916 RepID=A0A6N6M6B3_9FLAO|nr:LON peptidase substrate-binding domain-containing protein [Salibacter halophilus]KAB1065147.1 hypothetical protein F3059_04130 [Salibacter halophilus]
MTKKINDIGLFYLPLVVLPGESTTLHVFEARYKALIKESIDEEKPFGILLPLKMNREYGSLVRVNKITKSYHDGRFDVEIIGEDVFRHVQNIDNNDSLYDNAEIEPVKRERSKINDDLLNAYFEYSVKQLKHDPSYSFSKNMSIYELANKCELTMMEKYKLISTPQAKLQQNILLNHLNIVNALFKQEEALKQKFYLN